jgi:hypothetical protein
VDHGDVQLVAGQEFDTGWKRFFDQTRHMVGDTIVTATQVPYADDKRLIHVSIIATRESRAGVY